MSSSLTSSPPVLVVDREGTLGKALAQKLQDKLLTVFVSSQELKEPNVIAVPFHKKIPVIPDNSFSHLFVVFSGEKEILASLPSFVRKATQTNGTLIIVTSIFHFQEAMVSTLLGRYKKTKVVVVGDVFSPELILPRSPVTSLLSMAKMYGRVELTSSGLDELYPIALSDVAEGISAIGLAETEEGNIYSLCPPHPVTQLSFARMLQKLYPLLQIDFLKKSHAALPFHCPSNAVQVLQENYPLGDRLAQLDLAHTPLAKKSKTRKQKISVIGRKSPRKRMLVFMMSLLFFVLALPFILTGLLAFMGGISLQQVETQLEEGKIPAAYASARSAATFFTIADDTASTLRSGVSLIGLRQEIIGFQGLIHTGREVSDAIVGMLEAGLKLQVLTQDGRSLSKDEFIEAMNSLKQSMMRLQAIKAEGSLPKTYGDRLKTFETPLTLFINLSDAAPSLLGFDKPTTYLILFQNNAELRPTGGFIGSYGLLKLEKGKIRSFTIHDVYDADGQLTADIEPPFALKRHMGASHWFLRDSNFSPDFAESAAEAVRFLKLETGENVQGVIGIDVTFLTMLLDATGPIKLVDYNQTLTKENFYQLTQQQVEGDFFPGSTQKKDFLRAADGALMQKFERGEFSYQKLLQVITIAAAQKHLLFAFPDPTLQQLFTVNNLSSALQDTRKQDDGVFLDTIGINEANIGQNKSNFYLKRSLAHEVMIDGEGVVTGVLTVTYVNESREEDTFGGDYKAYLRLIAPKDTTLTGILIDKTEQKIMSAVTNENIYQARTFKAPEGVEVEETTTEDQALFGLVVTVPQGKSKTYTLSYRLAQRAAVDKTEWSYDMKIIKQPGTLSDPYSLRVTYPLANKLFHASLPVSDLGGKVLFESALDTDKNLHLTFTQR